jgi:hypothetical protein
MPIAKAVMRFATSSPRTNPGRTRSRAERGRSPVRAILRHAAIAGADHWTHHDEDGRGSISKPVQFYYSANTPKDYVEAVKDGILYWNRAFGTNVVRVEKAPEGVTAPDATRNIVQWVPWDRAGVAYADLLLDPRTGESRHGQAYMTSVFAVSGKASARRALRAMQELAAKKDGRKEKHEPGVGDARN